MSDFGAFLEKRAYSDSMTLDRVEVDGRPGRFSTMFGRAVPYDTWTTIGGWYREKHVAGSFKRSTDNKAKGLPLLLFHNRESFPIGNSTDWDHRADGLYGTWHINESSEAQRAASAAYDGELTGLSVGFVPERPHYDPDAEPLPELTHYESRLVEVSLTPTPAYEGAEVALVRTAFGPRAATRPEFDMWSRWVDTHRG
jgi:uncharacterized protein